MDKSLIAFLLLFLPSIALGQTHTMYGSNVVPSGASLTIQSGASITAAAGSTITGFGGGAGAVSSVFGRTGAVVSATNDYTFAQIGSKPTTISGYGITDAFTKTAADALYAPIAHSHTFASLTSKPTTLSGFGITDAYTKTEADANYATAAHTHTFAALTSKPTTFPGYGISDTSANLRSALTDEKGTGAALFNGADTPDFTNGITVGGAATSGKILQGDGTDYGPSTPTWPTAAGTAGYTVRSDGTDFASYPQHMINSATGASQSASTSDVYLQGSSIVVAAGDFKAKGQYRCVFDMQKTAGTGTIVITLRVGTAGTTSDPAIITFTCPGAGTGVTDNGTFEIIATWKIVGAAASVQGICRAQKNAITAAGLWNTTTAALTIISTASSPFNSTAATTIGVSFNGGTAFSGLNTMVQATLIE